MKYADWFVLFGLLLRIISYYKKLLDTYQCTLLVLKVTISYEQYI